MNSFELTALATVLADIKSLPPISAKEPNFFDVGGSGYLENPTSDLMLLFMGGQKNVPPWLAKALIACLAARKASSADIAIDWTAVKAEREVSFRDREDQGYKRLDIVLGDGNFVLGIENKVWASAHDNPFGTYDALLASRAEEGRILKCVLRPTSRSDDVPAGWPVVSYGELVAQALSMYGREIATSQISKWQVFYQEFLSHLSELSSPIENAIMSNESENFVLANYRNLFKANELLQSFSTQLQTETRIAIANKFLSTGIDTTIRTNTTDWKGQKALRFFPNHWKGNSHVVLTYLPEDDSTKNRQISFGIRAFIDLGYTDRDIEEIGTQFSLKDSARWPDSICQQNASSWPENNSQLLALDCHPKQNTKDGAILGIAEFSVWIQNIAFN